MNGSVISHKLLQLSFVGLLADLFIYSRIFLEIRVQDIAMIVMILSCGPLVRMIRRDKNLKQVFVLMLLYIYYIAMSNLVFVAHYGLWARHILYIIKEMEYFVTFFLAIYVYRADHTGLVRKIIKVFVLVNLVYGLSQVAMGKISYYGIGSLVTGAPSASGNVYFMASVLMFYLYLNETKKSNLLISIIMLALSFATVSRTYILASAVFALAFAGLTLLETVGGRRVRKSSMIMIIFLLTIVIGVLCACIGLDLPGEFNRRFSDNPIFNTILGRMNRLVAAFGERANKTSYYYRTFVEDNVSVWLFGKGKGITEQYFGVSTLAVDNQYLRALIEMGLIGSILWFTVPMWIARELKHKRRTLERKVFLSLFLSYLAASIGTEVFQTTRPAMSFWLVSGILFAHTAESAVSSRVNCNANAVNQADPYANT